MKKFNRFSYAVNAYSELNNIGMKWFKIYKALFLMSIFFSTLLLILFAFFSILSLSRTGILILIPAIIYFSFRCYTYETISKLDAKGYKNNLILLTVDLIIVISQYSSNYNEIIAIIPIAIYIIIWFVPNYIYFKKRQSIFSFMFSYPDNDNYEEPVYNNFDVFWTCPSCGIQNQSIKCSGCGLTKQEAEKINSEKLKQNEAVELIETKQKQGIETSNNTESAKSNELKFCNKCGSKLDDDFAFCNKCGNKVR